jgi:hypothetical protein
VVSGMVFQAKPDPAHVQTIRKLLQPIIDDQMDVSPGERTLSDIEYELHRFSLETDDEHRR